MLRVGIAVAVVSAACHKPATNCERAVKHVFGLITAGPKESMPGKDEQAVIDQVVAMSKDRCDHEGLTDAQRDCILASKSLTERTFLMCPALVAKPPSWIQAPIGHPEVMEGLEELKRQADTPSPDPDGSAQP